MKQLVTLVLVLCLSMALGACASHYKEVEQQAQVPVNCATAESDLRVLENEKVHVAEQIAAGVRSIVPIGLVAGLLTDTQGAKWDVATGDYNDILDKKIALIKKTCGRE